jgi:predicted ribosomally synthesized peptide with SipW-like signal peptide
VRLGGIASGAISLVTTAYFSDTDVVTLLSGSSKYLALRETVGRLALNPRLSDADRFEELAELQGEYVRLDETYSRYFHYAHGRGSKPPGQYGGWSARAYNIAREITDNLVGKL